jgi:hypothetical protein
MRTRIAVLMLTAGALLAGSTLAWSASAGATATKGDLFFDGRVVRTVVNPGAIPNGGTDTFYAVDNGVSGQLGITSVAPGSPGYNGGSWAVSVVHFDVSPYLLTSQSAVLAAEAAGDVTITRTPAADFRCPVQP